MAIWKHVACWISTVKCVSTSQRPCSHTSTHARARTHKSAIRIALPRQQVFRERASVLRYTYIACLVDEYEVNYQRNYIKFAGRKFISPTPK